ncbi:amino acid ABC transporter substrate-binding protein [Cucumibacter marinus]|uniref:amino acid ABC transporter substrate-binding protein n=1 Tax=Cucumibacter marinus TaxID=1121252 RepID=UPI000491DC72|nr:amino acid ABC transporter substrate-binding protein [Cucumibacter marinus]
MKTRYYLPVAAAFLVLAPAIAQAGQTFDAVKDRDLVRCGTPQGTVGFGYPDDSGSFIGMNPDFCHAFAAATLGDASKAEMVSLTSQTRFPALQTGEIDVLISNTTNTLTRDATLGINFGATNFYDGQGMMVPKSLAISSATELDGATVCVQPGTTTELNLNDYFLANNMTFNPLVIESVAEVREAFFSGRCDVYSTDSSLLAAARVASPAPDDFMILPERISKEPLAPLVRQGDDEWLDIVSWTIYATMQAEEYGINQANVDDFLDSDDPAIRRFLGVEPGLGEALGVDDKFAYNVVKQVGNYADIYNRWVGPDTALELDRGLNELWTNGGLLYNPPFR